MNVQKFPYLNKLTISALGALYLTTTQPLSAWTGGTGLYFITNSSGQINVIESFPRWNRFLLYL